MQLALNTVHAHQLIWVAFLCEGKIFFFCPVLIEAHPPACRNALCASLPSSGSLPSPPSASSPAFWPHATSSRRGYKLAGNKSQMAGWGEKVNWKWVERKIGGRVCVHLIMSSNGFDEAGYYEDHSSKQREVGLRLLELLDLKEGDKVLDLGCGTGYLTSVIAKRVGDNGMVSERKS